MNNEWHSIPGYDGVYVIDKLGQVRRVKLHGSSDKNGSIKPSITNRGYVRVALYKNGKVSLHSVHRLMMLTFVGDSELEVNHINGKKIDNRLENLEYVTRSDNEIHRARVLKLNVGEDHGNSKLTNNQVLEIRAKSTPYYHGVYARIAKEYNVTPECVSMVARRITYRYVL